MDARGSSKSLLEHFNNRFRFRHLGLGFLWAWIYCTWLSPALFDGATGLTTNNDISWTISVAFVTISLFVSPFLFKRNLIDIRWIRIAAPVANCLGAFAMAQHVIFGTNIPYVSVLGAAVTGIASGWLWIMWGEFFGSVDLEITHFTLPLTVAIPLCCMLLTLGAAGPFAGAGICILPLASGACLLLSLNDKEPLQPVVEKKDPPPGLWTNFLQLGIASLATYVAISFCWSSIHYNPEVDWTGWLIVAYIAGGILAMAIAYLSLTFSVRKNVFSLYRWLVPVVLFAFAALSFQTFASRVIAFFLITIVQYGFDIIVWVYFTSIIRTGACSGRVAAGINRGFVQLAVLLGSLLGLASPAWEEAGLISFASIAFIVLGCMVAAIFIVFVNPTRDQLSPLDTFDVATETELGTTPSVDGPPQKHDETDYDPVLITCNELTEQHSLTRREKEVLVLLARGRSIPYISDALFISKNTVESHVKAIYRKLDVHTRQELLTIFE
ncbi:response regulator transcription factor [Eggerthella sp. YY7918]|uniref:response regulator transcription factor n=1 Tax=Eggerthella sp. (strain YY7918) TaxID=502558 RepID=UPI0002171599|nr:helix-turn-helix transcriptional regulator [Eggerthella sp. YY7918]BAK45475.1 hypothetical protein EGYY_24060 [Eggerthella sp. YY7918]